MKHNVRNFPWIPVTFLDGTCETVSLEKCLQQAKKIKTLNIAQPVVHAAMLRFLVSISVLLHREANKTRITSPDDWVNETQIAATLDKFADFLYLDHPQTPFLQEHFWDATKAPASKPVHISALVLEIPGPSSKDWKVRHELDSKSTDLSLGQVTLNLVAAWYYSFAGNASSLYVTPPQNKPKNVSIGMRVGKDLTVFWRGKHLAATLLANTSLTQVRQNDVPGWADRSGALFENNITLFLDSELWLNNITSNAFLLVWGERGELVGFRRGGSKQLIPGVSTVASEDKSKKDSIVSWFEQQQISDPFRLRLLTDKGVVLFRGITAKDIRLINFGKWYSQEVNNVLSAQKESSVLRFSSGSADGHWSLNMLATVTESSGGSFWYEDVEWFTQPAEDFLYEQNVGDTIAKLYKLTIDSSENSKENMEAYAKQALYHAGLSTQRFVSPVVLFRNRFRAEVENMFDDIFLELKAGKLSKTLLSSIAKICVESYDEVTEIYSSIKSNAEFHKQRSTLKRRLGYLVKENSNEAEEK